MNTTKKLPVSISFDSFKTGSNEFLVPITGGSATNEFISIESGERFPYGALSYIGKEIDASEILMRMTKAGIGSPAASATVLILNKYLERLQEFKIGNVLAIEYSNTGDFSLVKKADRPPRSHR